MTTQQSLRCSRVAQAAGFGARGTASAAEAFVLVELPLPWPAKVEAHPLVAPLLPLLEAHGARLQALVPEGEAGTTRVVVYVRPPGPFSKYTRRELVVAPPELSTAVAVLLAGDVPCEAPAAGDGVRTGGPVDVLVCTHGSRDVCCGADGMRLYTDVVASELPGVRVWRTSHTGGHRFAPTAVTFPEGRAWAWLDADLLRRIVARDLEPEEIARHDRGCAAFADPLAQAAESAAFAEVGWPWLDAARSATVEAPINGGPARATVTGGDMSYEAEVVVKQMVPVPECGRPLEEATKEQPDLVVRRLP